MVVHPDHLADLYRFAWILVQRTDVATRLVCDAVQEAYGRVAHPEDEERQRARAFQAVRQRALKVPGTTFTTRTATAAWPDDGESLLDAASSDEVVTALHQISEPGRSALAMLLIDAVGMECLERMLGLPAANLAAVLDEARAAVANRLKSPAPARGES